MDPEITSAQIIFECEQEHGKGQLFFRTDGLEFESRRAALRRDYLQAHPTVEPEHREAILKAAATPGMTRDDVTAAWGLLEEDTRLSFGHVTDDRRTTYAFFTVQVGDSYALYFVDQVLSGVRRTDELVLPHEHELSMRLAEEYYGLYYFVDCDEGLMAGTDVYEDDENWASGGFLSGRRVNISSWPVERVEQHVRSKNLYSEYETALDRFGYDKKNLSVNECTRAALAILPYPPLPQEAGSANVMDDEGNPIPIRARAVTPPEAWFWHVASGQPRLVKFPTMNGQTEMLPVRWYKESIFVVNGVPLWVNGVAQFDRVLVEWRDGDPIPQFQQVVKNDGYRTVRVTLTDAQSQWYLDRFVREFIEEEYAGRYRYEGGVLALTLPLSALSDELRRALWYRGISWVYTDTMSQD